MKNLLRGKGRFLALLLCAMMVISLLPAGTVSVFAASDVYSNELISYNFNSQCYGYYFTPIQEGKYPTVVLIHGQGGVRTLQSHARYFINEWVKAGIFPPMNVVLPRVEDFDGADNIHFNDFFLYMKRDNMFGTLLEKIETGQLSSQIDTSQDVMVGGFSMGGMAVLECGSEYNTRVKKLGALSPAMAFYYGEGRYDGFYPYASDMYYSKDPDAFLFLSCGAAEDSGNFLTWSNRYRDAINSSGNNKPDLIEKFVAPNSWGGHSWPLEKKEIFMYLYRCFYGTVPSQSYVESICDNSTAATTPAIRTSDTVHPAPSFTVSPYGGDKLVNLDMSTYAKDTTTDPAATTGSVGNVSNTGTLASSTVVKMSSKSGTSFGLDTEKKTFTNNKGSTTAYLERKVNSMTAANNNYMLIDEPALETRDNTISFWAKYTPINRQNIEYSFFDYNATYSGESAPKHLFTFDQKATTESKFVLTGRWAQTGRWNDSQYGDITDKAAGKWTQFTITNPAYELNGKKTIKIYVNGEYLYSRVLTKPSGNATSVKLTFGGENTPGQYLYWPDTYTLGNVTVYDGALTSEEVYSEYNLNKDYYVEGTSTLPNITGYTFAGSTVNYDGASHMINVTAASGATQGVTTTYTCNGSAFTGATEPGTYNVTATIKKSGYTDLTLNATLKITAPSITGYTFSDSTVTYDGASHMINVTAASGATQDVTVTYMSNGAVFSGAANIGTYPITATISKAGYQSLVLTATMTIKTNTVPFVHDKYLDLDMTNLVPDSFTPTASSVSASSGIAKSGDWAGGTTLGISQRPDGYNTIKKGAFQNADGGTTNYLDYYNKLIYPNMAAGSAWAQCLINLQMHNTSFESADNTISFWISDTKSNQWKEILCYRVDYTSGGSKAFESFDLGINADGTWSALSAPTSNNPGSAAANAFSVPSGWKHVVITNPKRSGGQKTMNVYVNGTLKKTVTLDIPDGATIDRATISFFSKSIGSYTSDDGPWRTREAIAPAGKIGDFKIYKGVLTASEATADYSAGINRYTEGSGTPTLQYITGYTFSNSTVTYDGTNHMINVSEGSGATQGVNITYTSNGAAFTGATAVGTYPVTATISKAGYQNLVLSATLTIKSNSTSSHDVLLDLDMTNLVPESFTPTADSVAASSGIAKSGTWAEGTTLGFSQRPDGNTTLAKGSFQNAEGGTTYYLDFYDPVIYPNIEAVSSYAQQLINLQMHNTSFEDADSTISFWISETKSNMWKQLMCYRVDYTSGGSKAFESFDLGVNADGTWNALSAPTTNNPSGAATNAFSVPGGWKHVVITNPKRLGGQKTMNVYVNGALKKTVTLDIPDSATIDRATISFFSKSVGVYGTGADGKPDGPWRTREAIAPAGKIGDFKIYADTLSDSEAASEYNDSLSRFTEGSGTVGTISGYTFSDSTVTYDGSNHMINVTAGSGATQGVTTTYTVGGAAFTGATAVGTYPVTATITKEGYEDLVLNATLTITSNNPPSDDVLLDLDMSGFSAQLVAPSATSGEVTSGIVKSGTMASSTTISFSQRPNAGDDNSLTKGSFRNNDNGGTTYYIDYSDPFIKPVSTNSNDYDGHLMNMQFFNNDLESVDNTISFWVNDIAAHPSYMKQILCYRVDYNSNNCKSFDLVVNPDGTWNVISEAWAQLSNGFHSPVTSGAFSVPDGWKHVVITNPARSGGSKTMELYVNGEFKKSITLSIPDDATINHATVAFFGKATAEEDWWRARRNVLAAAKLSEIKVYDTALSASDVADEYAGSINRFTEGSSVAETITGYTFPDSTVTYDGTNHMINVSAASGATQDVTTAYTCNGAAFSGATQPGTYNVTATITKSGYNDLVLNATLTIEAPVADTDYEVKGIKNGDRFAVSAGGNSVQRVYVVNENASGLTPSEATGLSSADFYVDGALSGTATNNPCYYDLPIESGNHTLKVVAHKAGGGEAELGTYSYTAFVSEDTSDSVCEDFEIGTEGANVNFGTMNIASTESCTYKKAPGTGSMAMTFAYDGEHESGGSNIFLKNIEVPESKILTFDYDFYSADSSGNQISQHLRNSGGAVVPGYTFGTLQASKYQKDTWHHMSYVFDFESLTFRGYLDGYEIERGTLNDAANAYVRFYLNRYSRGTLYVDNIKFCGKAEAIDDSGDEELSFDVTYDADTNSFIVTGEATKGGAPSINRILLMVNEPGTSGEEGLIHTDALNNHSGPFEFTVPLSDTAPSGTYTFTVVSDGEVIASGTNTCDMTDNFGISGNIAAGSEISAVYNLEQGESAPIVFIAVYKDGGVVHVALSNSEDDGKVSAELKFGAGEDITGYTAKAFVWKDLNTLQPLKKERVFK